MKIRSKTIAYASCEDNLEKSIKEIKKKKKKNKGRKNRRYKILQEKYLELILLREKRMEVLLRSKPWWVAEGEKITKYFCSLEKRNFISKQLEKQNSR